MTLVVAWFRAVADTKELVVVADSRLTGAGYTNHGQKIFPLPREDCCLAFCGDSLMSYPIFIMVQSAIYNYPRDSNRSRDISDLKNHVLNLINFYVSSWTDVSPEDFRYTCHHTRFLLAGWSWRNLDFLIYEFFFSERLAKYQARRSRYLRRFLGNDDRNRQIVVLGDYRSAFFERLSRMINKGKQAFNYEPLAVVRDMLYEPRFHDRREIGKYEDAGRIGGPPQFLKIYASGTSLPHAVWWPCENELRVHLFGRPLLDYEITQFPIWDLERMTVQYPLESIRNDRQTQLIGF
jgi:hypothetical protein